MSTQSAVPVTATGSTEIASFSQTWTIGGVPTTVFIQAMALVDTTTGVPVVVDANGVHVVPVVGSPNGSGPISASNIAAQGNATLTSPIPVTSGKVGTLQHGIFSATQPMQWTVQTVDNSGAATSRFSFITDAFDTYDFSAVMKDSIATVTATTTQCVFQVVATSLSQNTDQTATAYASFFWAEN